jgi:hypothetical protein
MIRYPTPNQKESAGGYGTMSATDQDRNVGWEHLRSSARELWRNSVLGIMLGLVVIITIVKFTSNAMRKLKHARRLGQCEEHLGSKEGLILEMSDTRLIPLD